MADSINGSDHGILNWDTPTRVQPNTEPSSPDVSLASASLQTTQPTSGGAVTADSSGCANCVEPPRPQQWGPDLPFFGMSAMRTSWMAGAAAHKSG